MQKQKKRDIFSKKYVDIIPFGHYNIAEKTKKERQHRTSPSANGKKVHKFTPPVWEYVRFYVRVLCGIRTLHLEVLYHR